MNDGGPLGALDGAERLLCVYAGVVTGALLAYVLILRHENRTLEHALGAVWARARRAEAIVLADLAADMETASEGI